MLCGEMSMVNYNSYHCGHSFYHLFYSLLAANFTPGQGLQMKTSLLANSGIFTILSISMHCP